MSTIRRILVPTDFSVPADLAIAYAIDLAARQGSSLHLLHVLADGSAAPASSDGLYLDTFDLRAQLIDEARVRLMEGAVRCATAGVPATIDVIVGRPARVIVEQATRRGTDLIVMGTHGRTGFAHVVLGSVAEIMVRIAPCPVLTVRNTMRVADRFAIDALRRAPVPMIA